MQKNKKKQEEMKELLQEMTVLLAESKEMYEKKKEAS